MVGPRPRRIDGVDIAFTVWFGSVLESLTEQQRSQLVKDLATLLGLPPGESDLVAPRMQAIMNRISQTQLSSSVTPERMADSVGNQQTVMGMGSASATRRGARGVVPRSKP